MKLISSTLPYQFTVPFLEIVLKIILEIVLMLVFVLATFSAQADNRIVSTDGFVTELIFSLEQQEQLIAIDVTSTVPKGFKTLPNIGYHRNLSAEGLLNLHPSIVIGSEHMGPPSTVSALHSANIPLIQLNSAKTPEQLKNNVKIVASALKQQHKGEALNTTISKQISAIAGKGLHTERIAFLLSMDTSKLHLAGQGTNGDALIKLLGASNVSNFKSYQNVSAESLLAMNPSIILVAGKNTDTAVSELLQAQRILKYSHAGQNNKILSINGSSLVAGLSISAITEALRISQTLSPQHQGHSQ